MPERHGEQEQRIEDEGREESPAQVLGLADGRRVDERMHPRLHVPRGRVAGDGRGHEQPDQAAETRRMVAMTNGELRK